MAGDTQLGARGARRTPVRRALRRLERAVLGAAMGAIAFAIERRVLRRIRRDASAPRPARSADVGHRP